MFPDARHLTAIALSCLALSIRAQDNAPQPPDAGATLQVHVRSVLVPVVVRDAQGHAIGDLKQEDFKVFDQGKPRERSRDSRCSRVQSRQAAGRLLRQPRPAVASAEPGAAASRQPPAQRIVVFLFDDRHLERGRPRTGEEGSGANARSAACRMEPGDWCCRFWASTRGSRTITLRCRPRWMKLKVRQAFQQSQSACPDIDYYSGRSDSQQTQLHCVRDCIGQDLRIACIFQRRQATPATSH